MIVPWGKIVRIDKSDDLIEINVLKKDDELVEMGDLNVSDIDVAGMVNEAATVTGMKHNSTGVGTTIFGMSITSKEVRLGLVEKIKASALDDVIYGLTTAERKATHALILDLERGFNYLNSDSDDTPSKEHNRDITTNTGLNSSVSNVTLIDDDTTPSMDHHWSRPWMG
ncbi:hypothetical protein Tco_1054024 [Tanacetum coccineum]|uniref:Uncharacterized protein n=1 Tax=Tanacetum coccineum TaxID=301880 RepID=A0ABQ5GVL3_9ASTR